jgi:hypothetical protein
MKNNYIEKLKADSNLILKRKQMKRINVEKMYSCKCIGSIGAWSGIYKSKSEISDAIAKWCESGRGTCTPSE